MCNEIVVWFSIGIQGAIRGKIGFASLKFLR
jgi:hypothetical protein